MNFFNDPAYQGTLRERAGVPGDVTFEAQIAAASPLIYIIASSSDRDDVRPAASSMAVSLRDTVNSAILASRADAIAAVRKPFENRGQNIPQQAIVQMEDRVSELNGDNTNQLADIQLESSVTSTSPGVVRGIGLALAAGLVVAFAVTLAMGAMSRRVDSEFDLVAKTGLPLLAAIPRRNADQRARRYGQLANALRHSELSPPAALAVASPGELAATAAVGWAIASYLADQGVAHSRAGGGPSQPRGRIGTGELSRARPDAIDLDELVRPSARHEGVLELRPGADVGRVPTASFERL